MITIRVVSFNGQPPAQALEFEFDELGGTIGRADTNQLTLPDPGRQVSRLQARVVWRNGQFEIINLGANPLDVAGHNVAHDTTAAISPGDHIAIGGYVLEVAAPARDATVGGAAAAVAAEGAGRVSRAEAAVIPDDFDPSADPFAAPPAAKEAAAGGLGDLGFGSSGESVSGPGIDTMFGLRASARGPGIDPFADGALGAPPAGAEEGGELLDPLAALSGAALPAAKPAPVPDQVPEIRGAYRPPAARLPDDAFLSWEQPDSSEAGGEETLRDRVESAPVRPRVEVEPSPVRPSLAAQTGAAGAEATAEFAPPAAGKRPVAGQNVDALLRAFLDGLGMADLALPQGLTPETMETVGRLLREATQGTLDLLLARATTKREVRADVTMIVSRDNNPLKFSPNVEVALAHLLAPRGKGFLPPSEAMRDAYDDLRSHELGFMAGMRAALTGVLRRFDPEVLEQHLSAKSVVDSLVPMNRRARLWGLYTQLYGEIAREAEDDFHALFGREFLRAYEEQIERLRHRGE